MEPIPASIELDITTLTEAEQTLRVKDIGLDKGITILNDPDLVVARISTRPVEEEVVEKELAEEAVEAPEAASQREEESPEE